MLHWHASQQGRMAGTECRRPLYYKMKTTKARPIVNKSPVKVRTTEIGTGLPKICIPLVASDMDELRTALFALEDTPYDLIEWRADFYENVEDSSVRTAALNLIREFIGDHPLLFTFRTKAEGGNRSIKTEDYYALNLAAADSGLVDIVDVEIYRDENRTEAHVRQLHEKGVCTLGSNHDFEKTPPTEEIVKRLCRMQELNLDITKIAVMPRKRRDVLSLMAAAVQMEEQYGDRPCVTMSMGRLGVISRITGSYSGSAITFGTAGKSSAPGQIPVEDLHSILRILSESID